LAFCAAMREHVGVFNANEAEYMAKKLFDPRKFLKPGFDAITASVEERIDVFGSANKA
ncbi:MAG: fructose-bisphosphate aldolase, partial [Streptococcaceae bacterium]|nr:fructose-bisphosphate aldolase [Streptococcaceae bacterium]